MKNVAQHEHVRNRHIPVDFTDVNFRPSNIPRELRTLPNWVCWTLDSEQRKIPIDAATGKLAKIDDPNTWTNYSRALVRLQRDSCSGIGFIFNGAGYVGIDLDDCRDAVTGAIDAQAQATMQQLDSYSEISPSGSGVHIIVKGKKSLPNCRYGKVEIYENKRYFTVTGDVLDGRNAIKKRSLASLETRLASTKSTANTSSRQPDHSPSGETWKLICAVCEKSQSRSAAALEDEFRRRYPQFAKERDQEKGERDGKSYIRYEIERWLNKSLMVADNQLEEATDGSDWRKEFKSKNQLNRNAARYLIERLVPEKSLTIISAPSFHGKSWVVLHLGAALSVGRGLWGFYGPKRPIPFRYHVPEMDEALVRQRMERLHISDSEMFLVRAMESGVTLPLNDKRMLESSRGAVVCLDTMGYFNEAEDAANYQQSIMFEKPSSIC